MPWALAFHDLEIDRQIGDGAEQRQPTISPTLLVIAKVALRKSSSGKIGSGARRSTAMKARCRQCRGHQAENDRRGPRKARAAKAREQDEAVRATTTTPRRHSRCRASRRVAGDAYAGDHAERDRADRQIDIEDPAPCQVIDEKSAEQRTDDGREAEYRAEQIPDNGRARAAGSGRRSPRWW